MSSPKNWLISISCDEIGSQLHICNFWNENSKGWTKTSCKRWTWLELFNSSVQERSEYWCEKYSTRAWFQEKITRLIQTFFGQMYRETELFYCSCKRLTKISVYADIEHKCFIYLINLEVRVDNLDLTFCWLEFYYGFNLILI